MNHVQTLISEFIPFKREPGGEGEIVYSFRLSLKLDIPCHVTLITILTVTRFVRSSRRMSMVPCGVPGLNEVRTCLL